MDVIEPLRPGADPVDANDPRRVVVFVSGLDAELLDSNVCVASFTGVASCEGGGTLVD